MIENALYTSDSFEWETPKELYDKLNEEFHFNLDPCATTENRKCKNYFTKEQNGLEKNWAEYKNVFCNPPYGREIKKWIKKAQEESEKGATVVLLVPARTDTRWFHEYIYKKHEIRFIKGRLSYLDRNGQKPNRAPFPTMVVIMRGKENENNR